MTFLSYTRGLEPTLDQALGEWLRAMASDLPMPLRPTLLGALADGKRLRAGLLCLVSQALGGDLKAALPRAVTIECIHAASLIHDDYIDGDRTRRERPATWTIEGARKAVLLGDLLFATAIERMMAMSSEDGRVIARTIATVAKGACQEPTACSDALAATDVDYERIIFLKTGALFSAAAELGAIAANADWALRDAARTFGGRLGEAYQIADDLQDLATLDETAAGLPPALAPAVLRFAPRARSIVGRKHDLTALNALLPSMRMQMQQALERRLDAARDALASFPPSTWLTLLQAATGEIMGARPAWIDSGISG